MCSGICIKSNLFVIAVSGGSTRAHGQPSQKSINLKNNGGDVSKKFPASHPGFKLYQEIAEYGDEEIKRELAMDQELEYE